MTAPISRKYSERCTTGRVLLASYKIATQWKWYTNMHFDFYLIVRSGSYLETEKYHAWTEITDLKWFFFILF